MDDSPAAFYTQKYSHPLYQLNVWKPCVHVDCQPKLPHQQQVRAPERSTGAVSTLDETEKPNQGKFGCQKSSPYLTNFYGNNVVLYLN